MDGACKEWWYKEKIMGVSKKGYFCLFQPYILTINYKCLEDLLLIFGPSGAQNTILQSKTRQVAAYTLESFPPPVIQPSSVS